MHVIRNTEEIQSYIGAQETAVALGAFDGLHIGHRAVIREAVESGFVPVVFTFRDNPAERLAGRCRYLTTPEERLEIFERWGVQYVVMPDFSDVAAWPAERFLNTLRFGLHARVVTCGADFRFGKFAAGDAAWLARSCALRGAELRVVDTVQYKGGTVSATRIRGAIERGEMTDAAAMLGRPFGFCFEVVHGNHIGHTIGTPTINQHFPEQFILPRFGVYASAVHIGDKLYCGVTNVGVKPTVGSDRALSETWIPDFSGDLYGRALRLELLGFVRDERKFPDLSALKAEIGRNAEQARAVFNAYERGLTENNKPETSEWKVYFGSGFRGRRSRKRAGREIPVNKSFSWGGQSWRVPSVYACGAGLVVDFCMEVGPERLSAFLEKWKAADEERLTDEQRERIEAENPLHPAFSAAAAVNGRTLSEKQWSGVSWVPASCRAAEELPDEEAARVLGHYGLDASRGWAIRRVSFPWATKRRPALRTLSLTLTQEPKPVPGPHFKTPGTEQIALTHPVTGKAHTLTVQALEPQTADWKDHPFGAGWSFPEQYAMMAYTLSPDLPESEISVLDCARSDEPKAAQKPENTFLPEAHSDACIGVIGGADGPTAVFLTGKSKTEAPKLHAACSALHFEPAPAVEWRTVFHVKTLPDQTVICIGEEGK
ncbi:MAG: riboflavin biosynthesis protein RibF [Hominenteromicrobium sp.]